MIITDVFSQMLEMPPQIEQRDDMVDSFLNDSVWDMVIICEYLLAGQVSRHSSWISMAPVL